MAVIRTLSDATGRVAGRFDLSSAGARGRLMWMAILIVAELTVALAIFRTHHSATGLHAIGRH